MFFLFPARCILFIFSHAVSNVQTQLYGRFFFPKKEKPKLQKYGFIRKFES